MKTFYYTYHKYKTLMPGSVFCRPGSGSWFRGLGRCTQDTIIGSALCLPISAVYDDYHKAKTWRMHPYPPSIPSIDSMADSSSSLSTALST
ncbi:unnamed protein product, partial [Brassica rapa]